MLWTLFSRVFQGVWDLSQPCLPGSARLGAGDLKEKRKAMMLLNRSKYSPQIIPRRSWPRPRPGLCGPWVNFRGGGGWFRPLPCALCSLPTYPPQAPSMRQHREGCLGLSRFAWLSSISACCAEGSAWGISCHNMGPLGGGMTWASPDPTRGGGRERCQPAALFQPGSWTPLPLGSFRKAPFRAVTFRILVIHFRLLCKHRGLCLGDVTKWVPGKWEQGGAGSRLSNGGLASSPERR